LRIQLSVPKGTQTAQGLQYWPAQKGPKDWWSFVMAIVRVLYETEIVRRKVHSNGWCNSKGGKYDTREPEVHS
jgi:hypothetical protein